MKKVSLGIVFFSGMLMAGCGQKQQGGMPAGYKTMKVEVSNQTLESKYAASIEGRQDIQIYPQVSGTLTKLCVTEGQNVKKGQSLFIIDQVPYQAALQTAVANVEAAKAAVATAQLTYDSKVKLYENKVVSAFDMQTAKNSLLSAQAQVAQAKAQEISARNNLSYTVVKSPADGVIGTLPFRVGALVGPSIAQPLTVVSDNSEVYVYFSLTENQLLAYTEKFGSMEDAIKAFPPVRLELNDGSQFDEPGKIESVSGVIDRQTGGVTVRAVFPNKGRVLHSGSSGNILLPQEYKDCIVIPQAATVQMQDLYNVYKVVDGKAKAELVTVAPINDGQSFIVTKGLTAGDEIVAEGAGLVREGTQIK